MNFMSNNLNALPLQLSIDVTKLRDMILDIIKTDSSVRTAIIDLYHRDNKAIDNSVQPITDEKSCKNKNIVAGEQYISQGLEIFKKYQQLDVNIRDQFRIIFITDDFISFICSGIQQEAPFEIWEGIKRSLGNSCKDDLIVLNNMLSYFVMMVNYSLPEEKKIFAMSSQIGERYDTGIHSIFGINSKKQGDVAAVFLQGLMQGTVCRKKSLVRLE